MWVGRDSSVGIATHHWLDGPGIESQWGRDILQPSRPTLYTMVTGLLPGVKRTGRDVNQPPPSIVDDKEE